jgi:hypothetical protein
VGNANEESPFGEWKPLRAAHADLKDLFPTLGSLEWATKKHKPEYVAGGALSFLAGRLLLHPPRFRRVSLEIGQRALAERHCREAPPA